MPTPPTERSGQRCRNSTEFRYGTFARAVRLPAGACGEDAPAAYRHGVVTIPVPVPETKSGTRPGHAA
ncbi:Hsp20/alpha crystallin family protein [Streptomyces mirabilis]|uniref:Hsp20 family protein n=1 Tax=Streptomyces mirabilis TaxID=68239 RepID=UPI00201E7258|nr:Hsp20/alpha crystallin family protein [Streptomyces mirabilis]